VLSVASAINKATIGSTHPFLGGSRSRTTCKSEGFSMTAISNP